MALLSGFILFVLGLAAIFAWHVEALVFLKGAIPFGLLFWGGITILVGYSERKARREFARSLEGGKSVEADTEVTDSASVS